MIRTLRSKMRDRHAPEWHLAFGAVPLPVRMRGLVSAIALYRDVHRSQLIDSLDGDSADALDMFVGAATSGREISAIDALSAGESCRALLEAGVS